MYVVIVGCSETGYHLSKALIAGGHEVELVERDHNRYQMLADELGSVALLGDGTDEQTLRRAGRGPGRDDGGSHRSRCH